MLAVSSVLALSTTRISISPVKSCANSDSRHSDNKASSLYAGMTIETRLTVMLPPGDPCRARHAETEQDGNRAMGPDNSTVLAQGKLRDLQARRGRLGVVQDPARARGARGPAWVLRHASPRRVAK